jgi:hypothetical protein
MATVYSNAWTFSIITVINTRVEYVLNIQQQILQIPASSYSFTDNPSTNPSQTLWTLSDTSKSQFRWIWTS